jgi:UDP-glucuronate 4-epimerase
VKRFVKAGDRAIGDLPCREWTGRVLVTGAAGFIGSHLSERLVASGSSVVGLDAFTDYYDTAAKLSNLRALMDEPRFELRRLDLAEDNLDGLLDGVSHVIHLAGQPGVRRSFGEGFADYVRHNVLATQRLLEQALHHSLERFAFASSSSIYGDAPVFPTNEDSPRAPVSPYGMTKLACEELAAVYLRNFGVPVVGLRYFTVYGPRQRPDMAFTRFLRRAVAGEALPIFGSGSQVRDFTYIDDIVTGAILATDRGEVGGIYNLGGGHPVALHDALGLIAELLGRPLVLDRRPGKTGDAARTGCDGELARRELGFIPQVALADGLAAQLEWVLASGSSTSLAAAV